MMFLTEMRPLTAAYLNNKTQPEAPRNAAFAPRVSLHETSEAYFILAELPGVKPEAVEVTLVKDELTIKGQKTLEALPEGGVWHLQERPLGGFERTFKFPAAIAPSEAIEATMEHGILTVRVAKAREVQPRRIQVVAR